jgi:hypothetical protein
MEQKTIFYYNPDNRIFEEYKYNIDNINANGNNDNDYDKVSNYYIIRGIWLDLVWFNVKTRVVKKGEDTYFEYKIDHSDKKFLKNLIFNENVPVVTIPPNISKYNSDIIDKFDYMEGVLIATHQLSIINSHHFVINKKYIYLCNHFQYSIDNHLNKNFNIVNKKMPSFHIDDVYVKEKIREYDNDESLSTFRIHILNNSSKSELLKWNTIVYSTKFHGGNLKTFSDDPTEIAILLLDKDDNLKDYIKCNLIFKKKELKYKKIMNNIIDAVEHVILTQDNFTIKYVNDITDNKDLLKKLNEKKILLSNYVSYLKANKLKYDQIYNTIVNITEGYFNIFNEDINDPTHHKMANSLYYMLLIIIYDNIDLLNLGWITYDRPKFRSNGVPDTYGKILTHFGANMFNNDELREYFINLKKSINLLLEKMDREYEIVYKNQISNDFYYKKLIETTEPKYDHDDIKNILKSNVSVKGQTSSITRGIFVKLYYDRQMLYLNCDSYEGKSFIAYYNLSNKMQSLFEKVDGFKIDAEFMIWLHQDFDKIKVKLNMFSKKLRYVRDKRSRNINENEIDDDDDGRGKSKKRKFSNYMTLNDLKMFSRFFK